MKNKLLILFLFIGGIFAQKQIKIIKNNQIKNNFYTITDENNLILSNSDSIYFGKKKLIRNHDYIIYYGQKKILFLGTNQMDSLILIYDRFPLKQEYDYNATLRFNREDTFSTASQYPLNIESHAVNSPFKNNFTKSGSIYRGFQMGASGDLRLQSGMNIFLEGNLTESIYLKGILNEEEIPIQPEGSTQQLSEIDKIYLEIRSPFGKGIIGDFNRRFEALQIFNELRLKGFDYQLNYENYDVEYLSASKRSLFASSHFFTSHGFYGPYKINNDISNDILIIAGSERVMIDGRVLTRGFDRDYTIDYHDATITFSTQVTLQANQKIELSYEYSSFQQKFDKNLQFYHLRHQGKTFGFTAEFYRDYDDLETPLFSQEKYNEFELNLIKNRGDNDDAIFYNSATLNPNQTGNYDKVYNVTFKDSIYVYNQQLKGSYDVRFAKVNVNEGSYKRLSRYQNIYEYVGKRNGDYEPLIRLYLPSELQSYFFSSYFYSENHRIKSSIFLNRFDLNSQNQFEAALHKMTDISSSHNWNSILFLDNFNIENSIKIKDKQFRLMQELPSNQFETDYGIENYSLKYQRLDIHEKFKFNYSNNYKQEIELKSILDEKVQFSHYSQFTHEFKLDSFQLSSAHHFLNARNDNRQRLNWLQQNLLLHHNGTMDWKINYLFYHRNKTDSLREKTYFSHQPSFQIQHKWKQSTVNYLATYQMNKYYHTFSKKYFIFNQSISQKINYDFIDKVNRHQIGLLYQGNSSGKSLLKMDSERKIDLIELAKLDTGNRNNENFQLDYTYNYDSKNYRLLTRYSFGKKAVSADEIIFKSVQNGYGNFRFDSLENRFIPDANGNYLRFILANGRYVPVNAIRLDIHQEFKATNISNHSIPLFFKYFDLISQFEFRISNETEKNINWNYYLFVSDELFSTESTRSQLYINPIISFQSDLYELLFDMKYEKNYYNLTDNDYNGNNSRIKQFSSSVEYRYPLSGKEFKLNQKITISQNENITISREDLKSKIDEIYLKNEFIYRPEFNSDFRFEVNFLRQVEELRKLKANAYESKLTCRYRFNSVSNLLLTLDYRRVEEIQNKDNVYYPYEFMNGNKVGDNFSITANVFYELIEQLQLELLYSGRKLVIFDKFNHFFTLQLRYQF